MSTQPTFATRILVPTDLSPASNWVFPDAITLAQAFGSKLFLVHAMHPKSVNEPERLEDFPKIEAFFNVGLAEAGLPPLQPEVVFEKIYLYNTDIPFVIVELAKRRQLDLICMAVTSREHKFPWRAGKIIDRVLKRAECSVLALRSQPLKENAWKRPRFCHVLLIEEPGEPPDPVLTKLLPWLQLFNSTLHVFPLRDGKPNETAEAKTLQALTPAGGAPPHLVPIGSGEKRLPKLLAVVKETPIDLIVMPPRIRGAFSNRLFNDVFVQLLRATDSPVLFLR